MMWGRRLTVVLAVVGILFGIYMVIRGSRELPAAQPIVTPAPVPFERYVSGAGIVESSSQNIEVATPLSGIVDEVLVHEGDLVERGQPLFRLDTRDLMAQWRLSQAEFEVANNRVSEAASELDDRLNKLSLANKISDKRAISQEELDSRRHAVRLSRAKLATAKAEVEKAEAQIGVIETDIQRMTIESPIDGEVLQINIRSGEYAPAGQTSVPLMLLGTTSLLHVRVDINENDAWRFTPGEEAVASPRGNPELQIPLTFVRVEPYIIPKRSLTGEATERVDTRVLQVIYSFDPEGLPVYVGQQMDVSIETDKGGD